MPMEQQGFNDGASGKGMAIDPNWSAVEREKYIAAYTNGKKKTQE